MVGVGMGYHGAVHNGMWVQEKVAGNAIEAPVTVFNPIYCHLLLK
jgi:hypothetical protein